MKKRTSDTVAYAVTIAIIAATVAFIAVYLYLHYRSTGGNIPYDTQ